MKYNLEILENSTHRPRNVRGPQFEENYPLTFDEWERERDEVLEYIKRGEDKERDTKPLLLK
jgi:hypothetical protein